MPTMAIRARTWLLIPLGAVLAAGLAVGLHSELGWAALAAHETALHRWVAAAPIAAGAIYVAAYVACVLASLPIAVLLTLTGGLLFGAVAGTALALLSATTGAVLFFLLARGALGPIVARRASPMLQWLRPRLQREGFWYLLALRLTPVVPFWLVNLAAGLVGMRLAPFALASVLGIAPLTAVVASVGAGLQGMLAAGARPDLSVLRSPPVLLPIAGLIVLSLLPVAWRRWRRTP
jgi:uncharacterized membrane protein YdjX (TVP38/TMEM64 family)